jgi:hypothetical protein
MVEPLKFTDVGSYEEFAAMEIDRLRQLEFGPGGIMEMKQTIADKEAEIDGLRKLLDLVYEYDSNLLDSLRGWK